VEDDSSFVSERLKELEQFLQRVVGHESLKYTHLLYKFLTEKDFSEGQESSVQYYWKQIPSLSKYFRFWNSTQGRGETKGEKAKTIS